MTAITPLNFQDVSRIINTFDLAKFNAPPLTSRSYAQQMIVVNQLERSLYKQLPVELIDQIVRSYFESAPSVGGLLMYYIGSPAIIASKKYNYPLSSDELILNGASKILLLKLQQKPSEEKESLACFKQLMTCVFNHYYQQLDSSQRLLLLQRCQITSWAEKSPEEKFRLLGRVQSLCGWGQPQIKLQFLSWKIRFAVAHALNRKFLSFVFYGPVAIAGTMFFANIFFVLLQGINSITFKNKIAKNFIEIINTKLSSGLLIVVIGALILSVCGCASSLFFAASGMILTFRYLPVSIQEKGRWIQSMSWSCFQLYLHYFLLIISFLPHSSRKDRHVTDQRAEAELREGFHRALAKLNKQLTETINEAKIPMEQEKFIEAQLPELLEKWHLLISQHLK